MISKRVDAAILGNESLDAVLTLGYFFMRHHANHCNRGVLVDTTEDIRELQSWFDNAADREGDVLYCNDFHIFIASLIVRTGCFSGGRFKSEYGVRGFEGELFL